MSKDCECKRSPKCKEPKCSPCSCKKPVLEIEPVPGSTSALKFNVNGVSAWYDFDNLVYQTQTDTVLSADSVNRVLKYMAERHIDTISAKELGAVLHMSDIGDVNITGIQDNAIFVYQKDSSCGEGCEGINNSWIAWNSQEHGADSVQTLMGFDANGVPQALNTPANANQYYMLGWNGSDKLKYSKPVQFNALTNKAPLYVDKTTGQIGWYQQQ